MLSRTLRYIRRRPFSAAAGAGLLLLLTAAAAWLWAHEGHTPLPSKGAFFDPAKGLVALSPEAREALGVQTGEVQYQALDERLAAPAALVAPWGRNAYATTRVGGKVTAVHVRPGQAVSRGQPLAEVQSLELETLQLELLTARANARLTEANLAQPRSAPEGGAVAEHQLLETKAAHQENLNAQEIARRKLLGLGLGEADLDRLLQERGPGPVRGLPVLSPIDGVVIHTDVQVGQIVEPTQHLLDVVDLSTVWVKVAVLEKDLPRVEVGQRLEVRLPAYSDVFAGTVTVKGLSLDPQTRQGTVWADLANPAGQPPRLFPGMVGQAEIILPA